jgi:hypothetical protein
MYGKKNPGPIGVSPGATVGDMIQNSRMQKPRAPAPRMPKRVNDEMIRTTVDFRPSPMGRRGMR